MNILFHKYHGAGNDFILINCMKNNIILSQKQIFFLCNRHLGIGADGLIRVLPSESHDFKMMYYNADGFEGSMCGNGGRTVAAFAYNEGLSGQKMKFIAYDGEHEAIILNSDGNSFEVKLSMKDVKIEKIDKSFLLVNTGSPHYVCLVDNLADFDVVQNGRKIRYDRKLSAYGINVNFMEKKDNQIYICTYERGVEDETLSCGTGVIASAIASSLWYDGTDFNIITRGGNLQVNFKRAGNIFSKIELTGPVKSVYNGNITL